jgi:nucleolar protein 12
LSSIDGDFEDDDVAELMEASDAESQSDVEGGAALNPMEIAEEREKAQRKRKRGTKEDDVEGKYMLKLAKEEEKEEKERKVERRLKRQRLMAEQDPDMSEESEDLDSDDDEKSSNDADAKRGAAFPSDVPKHESLAPDKETAELEKAARTVFLANVSTTAITDKKAKKALIDHLESFVNSIPAPFDGKTKHKVDSIRFRSTAYAGSSLPKKAAFATKALMDATTKSTNAYAVYTTSFAAREAAKRLNATMVLDRHLRVDSVAHPAKTDHRRCVFVGNLGFVDDESNMDEAVEGQRKRSRIPSDIEEGLWRQFGKAGEVESVRVVRDEKTRVGKGFAYVQFKVSSHMSIFVFSHILTLFRTQTPLKQLFSSTKRSSHPCSPASYA